MEAILKLHILEFVRKSLNFFYGLKGLIHAYNSFSFPLDAGTDICTDTIKKERARPNFSLCHYLQSTEQN